MTKQDYADIYKKKMDEIYKWYETDIKEHPEDYERDPDISWYATFEFEDVANANEVVGYYVELHGDSALKDWTANTAGICMNDQDKIVDKILHELYD